MLVDGPDGLTLVEAKSSATPASSLLDGVKRVRPHVQDLRPRCDAAVVYGGEEVQQRAHGRLVPWRLEHRHARLTSWLHLLAVWPLPVLLFIHILSAYLF